MSEKKNKLTITVDNWVVEMEAPEPKPTITIPKPEKKEGG